MRPILGRILVALGITMVTVTGVNTAVALLKNQLVGSINALPADMLNLFLLSGLGHGLGIIAGAITTRLLIAQAGRALKFVSGNSG